MVHSHTEHSKGFSVVHCLDVLEGTSFPTQALGLPCGSKKRPTRHQKIWTHNISAGIPSEVFITVIDASLWSIIKDRGNCQVLATYVPMWAHAQATELLCHERVACSDGLVVPTFHHNVDMDHSHQWCIAIPSVPKDS